MSISLKNNGEEFNILVVKYRALGDSVMGLSTISYLRSIYPNSKIYYGIRNWTTKLYDEVETDADGIISLSFESLSDFYESYKKIKELNIHHIHELHQSGRSKKFFNLYQIFNKVKYTFHNHHLKSGGDVLGQGEIKPLIQRDLDGAYSFLGKGTKEPDYLDFPPIIKHTFSKKDVVILGVVATRETKMWDLENYLLLAKLIKKDFPSFEITVPLSRSKDDLDIKDKFLKIDREGICNIVHEDLSKIPKLIAQSKLYVGNDTGLKHIAIACDVKSYTLFGPEPPNEWHPYDKESHPYFFIDPLECRYREAHYCGLSTCESMICLKDIKVQDVYKKIKIDLEKV